MGVYAIIRTETMLFLENDVNFLLMIVALAMIVGVLGAVAQAELKRILSFTLVSHIGYMIFGIAIATPASIGATIYYMVHHIVVQTTLFLAVGLVERRAGSTSILRVKGLMRAAPVIAILYFIPAVNLGGLPPFSGFIGKFALFDAAAEVGTPIMMVLIVGGIVTSSSRCTRSCAPGTSRSGGRRTTRPRRRPASRTSVPHQRPASRPSAASSPRS